MDVATNVRTVRLSAMHVLHVTKKTEVRQYRLNASGKRNETENGNKTERSGNGHTVLTTCKGNKTGTIFDMYHTVRLQLFAGIYTFSGFGILCILLVLNVVRASQLMIFMMVCSQYLIFTSIKFCAFVQIHRNIKRLVPAKIALAL